MALLVAFSIIVLPLVIGVVLAATIGGWVSVVIAVVSWLGLAIVVGVVIAWGLRVWIPIKAFVDAAGRLADGDYTARVGDIGTGVVRPISHSFDRMAERLEAAETDRRRLVADVGHELRTPLTIVRGELEAMADGVHEIEVDRIRALLGDVGVMERLLDDLRTLSRAEAGTLQVHREPTELIGLATETVDRFAPEAATAGVALALRSSCEPDELEADVDAVRVQEIIANLVQNALRATPGGGTVDVSIGPGVLDGEPAAELRVADDGRGIPADEVDRVFDRFHSGAGSDGSGLGLTITRDLVDAHDGSITLTSEIGQGTTVTVLLPLGDRA